MFIRLMLVFIIIPIIEIYVLLSVGNLIGLTLTIALVLLTGIAGAYLARTQGLNLMLRIQQELEAGRVPTEELIDGAMVLAGGLLLLTPGFCTDLTGFLLLAPFSREVIKVYLKKFFTQRVKQGRVQIYRK